ncbi:unnamed protein product [Rotaria magnacalcarata]|nr:unnamed protein product [Rotaria magnacalcarata]
MAMFTEAPFFSMLIIGLPASVLSIVCYCLCCLPNETMNDPDYSYEIITDDQNLEQNEEEDDDDASSPPVTTDDNQKTVTDKKED